MMLGGGLDQLDPAIGIPTALVLWAVYGVIKLRERKLARDETQK